MKEIILITGIVLIAIALIVIISKLSKSKINKKRDESQVREMSEDLKNKTLMSNDFSKSVKVRKKSGTVDYKILQKKGTSGKSKRDFQVFDEFGNQVFDIDILDLFLDFYIFNELYSDGDVFEYFDEGESFVEEVIEPEVFTEEIYNPHEAPAQHPYEAPKIETIEEDYTSRMSEPEVDSSSSSSDSGGGDS